MTATTLSHLPIAAGSAVVTSVGRLGLWALTRFFRAPLTNTALTALVGLTALAGSNALYFQGGHHPAPLFAQISDAPAQQVAVAPAPRPQIAPRVVAPKLAVPTLTSNETTGSVTPHAVDNGPAGNADVYQLQKKLNELRLFDGLLDGYYGPQTAKAIRAFEERNGLEPLGAMTPEIVDAILRADADGRVTRVQQQAAIAPVPTPVPVRAPAPIVAPVADQVVARLPNIEPVDQLGEALGTVADSAATTIDSIVAAIDGGRSLPAPPAVTPVPSQSLSAARRQLMPQPVPQADINPPVRVAPVEQVASLPRASVPSNSADTSVTAQVQRGLASLGFLHGPIDGQAGEATAKAIRNFEVYYNYNVTGRVSPELVDLLIAAGASV